MLSLLRLILVFGIGFVTWLLALGRTYALIEQRKSLVCSLIFMEETILLGVGIWLARQGNVYDIVSCAAGGTLAAWWLMRYKNDR